MNDFNGIEMTIENSLNFQETYKDLEAQIVDDDILHTIPDPPRSPTNECTQDNEDLSYEYESKIVEYWKVETKKMQVPRPLNKNSKSKIYKTTATLDSYFKQRRYLQRKNR